MLEQEVLTYIDKHFPDKKSDEPLTEAQQAEIFRYLFERLAQIYNKKNYAHYFDIRTNHLNEKDWRRSFSINQFLYGIILAATADGKLHNSFDEIIPILKDKYSGQEKMDFESEWR